MDDEIIGRMLGGTSPSQDERTVRQILYSAEARSHASGLWETGFMNSTGRRPWREDYQTAVRQVLPALDRYGTVDELITTHYGAVLRAEVMRVSQLADGRVLDYLTIEGAAFWLRYVALTRTGGEEMRP
ncbi:MAG TPA: hypothetical protein VF916_09795 [Ktedonobacterales bacterium]